MMTDSALVFYIDEQLLLATANFVLDYLLLWATAATTRTHTNWQRLMGGAGMGTIYYVLYVLSVYRIIPFYGLFRMLITVAAVSLLMLAVVFAPLPRARFWSAIVHFYVISFVSAGSGLAGAHLFGGPGAPNPLVGVVVAISSLLLVAELGWGVLQRRNWRQGLLIPIDITFGQCTIRITALLDTGNRLRDPISGVPVLVVEYRSVARFFPPKLAQALAQMVAGDLRSVSCLHESAEWSARFRIVPFNSVGATNGMMVGFRPNGLTIWHNGKPYHTRGCIVALSPRHLDSGRVYQALISPDLLENVAVKHEPALVVTQSAGFSLKKEESAHAVTHG